MGMVVAPCFNLVSTLEVPLDYNSPDFTGLLGSPSLTVVLAVTATAENPLAAAPGSPRFRRRRGARGSAGGRCAGAGLSLSRQ